MPVFVSYRRVDSEAMLIVYSWLRERFGTDGVFWDAEDIPASARWSETIRRGVAEADALVVVIGPGWADLRDASGERRLDDQADWVRQEIAMALARELPVIPVLAPGATVPAASQLPDDIAELVSRQAISMETLRARRQLLDLLESRVPVAPSERTEDTRLDRLRWLLERQVQRLQLRAVELVQEDKPDRAREELKEGSELLLELVALTPMSLRFSAQLGYLYGSIADAMDQAGDDDGAERYVGLAQATFSDVAAQAEEQMARGGDDVDPAGVTEATDIAASALNGLAGVLRRRGRLAEAIDAYGQVVAMLPDYTFAWHDLVAALLDVTEPDEADVGMMVPALERLLELGPGTTGLSQHDLADIEARVRAWLIGAGTQPPAGWEC
jgi:tetratricopeptide (TPR) repeat protein